MLASRVCSHRTWSCPSSKLCSRCHPTALFCTQLSSQLLPALGSSRMCVIWARSIVCRVLTPSLAPHPLPGAVVFSPLLTPAPHPLPGAVVCSPLLAPAPHPLPGAVACSPLLTPAPHPLPGAVMCSPLLLTPCLEQSRVHARSGFCVVALGSPQLAKLAQGVCLVGSSCGVIGQLAAPFPFFYSDCTWCCDRDRYQHATC